MKSRGYPQISTLETTCIINMSQHVCNMSVKEKLGLKKISIKIIKTVAIGNPSDFQSDFADIWLHLS